MVDLYFECKPENYDPELCQLSLLPDGDILPIDKLTNCFELYRDDQKVIVKYRADALSINELQNQTGCENPLSQEAVDLLGITGSYIGNQREDIFLRYPELDGVKTVETEDGVVDTLIVRDTAIL